LTRPSYEAIFLDTETTTNKDTPERPLEVVELAWMPLNAPGGFRQLYKPTMPCTWGATAVHHILPLELLDQPPAQQAPSDLPLAKYWIGHNIDFDWNVLGKPNVKRICTLAIARKLYPELDSHKLGAMYYALNGATAITRTALRDAHSAAADVEFCTSILNTMLAQRAPMQSLAKPEALWSFSEFCRIPDTITFGKHKGAKIADIPKDYVTWMLRQPDMDEYLVKAVKAVFRKSS